MPRSNEGVAQAPESGAWGSAGGRGFGSRPSLDDVRAAINTITSRREPSHNIIKAVLYPKEVYKGRFPNRLCRGMPFKTGKGPLSRVPGREQTTDDLLL